MAQGVCELLWLKIILEDLKMIDETLEEYVDDEFRVDDRCNYDN